MDLRLSGALFQVPKILNAIQTAPAIARYAGVAVGRLPSTCIKPEAVLSWIILARTMERFVAAREPHVGSRVVQEEWSVSVAGETRQRRLGMRASANAAIRRHMHEQSLRTPWRDFAKACEQLIEWHSFALWVRAIVDTERSVPQWLKEAIARRCPGFPEPGPDAADGDSIWLDLSEWIVDHFFAPARDGGWIDALHYYSGQDPMSEQIWSHWTRTEATWLKRKPKDHPTFNQWHKEALNGALPDAGTQLESVPTRVGSSPPPDRLAVLVSQYIEWEAFAFWTRLMVERYAKVPAEVAAAIEQRCPGFLDYIRTQPTGQTEYGTWFWRELLSWIENHIFADTGEEPWLDTVRDTARTHLRGERIAAYWAYCSSQWRKNPPASNPSAERWLSEADAFVVR